MVSLDAGKILNNDFLDSVDFMLTANLTLKFDVVNRNCACWDHVGSVYGRIILILFQFLMILKI